MQVERRNQMRSFVAAALALGLLLATSAALARPSDEEIARLGGPDLTPVGAERAGNADGTIPEWTGGVTKPPEGWEPGQKRVDLFADDKILFTIDASNVDQYADKLSPGQINLIKSYDGYKMNVYPTRRSCAYPQDHYDIAKSNARVASVDESECLLTNGIAHPLFPIPQTGCEAIQNGRLSTFNAIRGFDRVEAQLIPTRGGSFEPGRREVKTLFRAELPDYPTFESLEGVWRKYVSHTTAPAKQAGEITLVYWLTDGHLKAWTYNPGQRRVRLNPLFEYDNPNPVGEGLTTVDQQNGFTGAADRYSWKLIGKQELYIPYNGEKLFNSSVTYKDMVQTRYPTRDLMRYELHRVWVVEATVRPDRRHTMAKRVFYIDEDSWLIVVVDAYDTRGNLWRVSEHMPRLVYELPSCVSDCGVYYDLVIGRYYVSPIVNEDGGDYLAGHEGRVKDKGFKPDDLRRMGRR